MDLLHRLICAALGAVSLFYMFVRAAQSHWSDRGILHKKPDFLVGNLNGVGWKRHIGGVLRRLYDDFKGRAPFIGFYAYLKPMLVVLDLDLVQRILSEDASYFIDRGLYNNVHHEPLSANLVQLDGAAWKELRAKLQAAFEADKVEVVLPALRGVAARFESSLRANLVNAEEDVFAVNCLVESFNLDVVSRLAFGLDGDSTRFLHTKFRHAARSYLENSSLVKAYLALSYPTLAYLLQYRSYDQEASEYFEKLVVDTLKERNSQPRLHGDADYLNIFAELTRGSDREKRLAVSEVAPQSFAFILASLEACTLTMTFCLYELALQPEIQQRAHEEIVSVLHRHGDQLTSKSLGEMEYLKRVIYETLRKHSPCQFLLRQTVKDYEVPDSVFMLREGNHLIIPIAAIHYDPDIYPQPDTFDPDRFRPDAIKERHPMAWLPFGAGPRSCIAQQLAETQMLVGMVSLLRHCRFSPSVETAIPIQYDSTKLLLAPSRNVQLRVERI